MWWKLNQFFVWFTHQREIKIRPERELEINASSYYIYNEQEGKSSKKGDTVYFQLHYMCHIPVFHVTLLLQLNYVPKTIIASGKK